MSPAFECDSVPPRAERYAFGVTQGRGKRTRVAVAGVLREFGDHLECGTVGARAADMPFVRALVAAPRVWAHKVAVPGAMRVRDRRDLVWEQPAVTGLNFVVNNERAPPMRQVARLALVVA